MHFTKPLYKFGEKNKFAKLNKEKVLEIKRRLANGDLQKDIAKDYGVAPSTIGHIARSETWRFTRL
jgi:hypothetical protein